MTVTAEQWAIVAAERRIPVEKLMEQIAEIDKQDVGRKLEVAHGLSTTMFDWDLDPLTLGEWACLKESRFYRFLAETILPSRYWIATIWQGVNEEMDEPPIVMESAVFKLPEEWLHGDFLPDALHRELHATKADALEGHQRLVLEWARRA